MKTSELIGTQLDWAVANCEGGTGFWYDSVATYWITIDGKDRALSRGWAQSYLPSTDWAQGGPIIERELIECAYLSTSKEWAGFIQGVAYGAGPTPLIAAMRCYVASNMGDDVEVPNGL